MCRIKISRGDDDRAPLGTDVIKGPGEDSGSESQDNKCALPDQSTSAGDRTTIAIAVSTVRRSVAEVSTSILKTTS